MAACSLIFLVFFLVISRFAFALGSAICPRIDLPFLDLHGGDSYPQCPLSVEFLSPAEISGEALTTALSHGRKSDYYSIFFYASWCPFSEHARPLFDALCSMFPQMRHFKVEESSSLPSVFSIYGVHSFPSLMIVNQTRKMHYHGPKDLSSLVYFYKKATGFEPVVYLSPDHLPSALPASKSDGSYGSWIYSPRDIMSREPYLALATLFIALRMFFYLFPGILSKVGDFCESYIWSFNLGVFGGSNHLIGRALQAIDVKRLWSKLSLFNKTRNFQKGANNARVWASSLASVSLGESSSTRSSASDS